MPRGKDCLTICEGDFNDFIIDIDTSPVEAKQPQHTNEKLEKKRQSSEENTKKIEINVIVIDDEEPQLCKEKEVTKKVDTLSTLKSNKEDKFLNKKKKRESEETLMSAELDRDRRRERDYQKKSEILKNIYESKIKSLSKEKSTLKITEKHNIINLEEKNVNPLSKTLPLMDKSLIKNNVKPEVENKIIYASQVSFPSNWNQSLETRMKILEEKLQQKEKTSNFNATNESDTLTSQKLTDLNKVSNVLIKLFGATAKLVTQIEDTISNKLEKECNKCQKEVKEADLVALYNNSVRQSANNKRPQKSNNCPTQNSDKKYFSSNYEMIELDSKNEGDGRKSEGWIARDINLKPQHNEKYSTSIANSPHAQGHYSNFNSPYPYNPNYNNPFAQGNTNLNSPPYNLVKLNSSTYTANNINMSSPTYQELSTNQNNHFQKSTNFLKSPTNDDNANKRILICYMCKKPGHKKDRCPQNK